MYELYSITSRIEFFSSSNKMTLEEAWVDGSYKAADHLTGSDKTNINGMRIANKSYRNGFNGRTVIKNNFDTVSSSRSSRKRRYRVLHIEDDPEIQYLVQIFLKKEMDVDSVLDGPEALTQTSDNSYDLIITDINLGGGMDGIEATREIRNRMEYKDIPVIAATANAGSEIRNQCKDVGMEAFLLKPFMKQDLLNIIEQVMENR
ncbi:MAG: response regulator [Balneolales bacterium]